MSCGFAIHTIELAQRLRAHQKAHATAAHGRNTPLKIGDAAHVGKLIQNKLHAALQMPTRAGVGAALGQVKQLLKGNVGKPCIGRVVVAHLKIDYALALVDTVKTHFIFLIDAHELGSLKPRDGRIECDQNTLKRPIGCSAKIAVLLNAIQVRVRRLIPAKKFLGLHLPHKVVQRKSALAISRDLDERGQLKDVVHLKVAARSRGIPTRRKCAGKALQKEQDSNNRSEQQIARVVPKRVVPKAAPIRIDPLHDCRHCGGDILDIHHVTQRVVSGRPLGINSIENRYLVAVLFKAFPRTAQQLTLGVCDHITAFVVIEQVGQNETRRFAAAGSAKDKHVVGHARLPVLIAPVKSNRGTVRQDHIALLIAGRQRLHFLLGRPLLGLILRLLCGLVAVHLNDRHVTAPFLSMVLRSC